MFRKSVTRKFPYNIIFSAWWNIATLQWEWVSQNLFWIFKWNISIILEGNKWYKKSTIVFVYIFFTIFVRTLLETIFTDNFPLDYTQASHKYTKIFIMFTLYWRLVMTMVKSSHILNFSCLYPFIPKQINKFKSDDTKYKKQSITSINILLIKEMY